MKNLEVLSEFDFEDLHKKLLEFDIRSALDELGKPRTYTIGGNEVVITLDITTEEDAAIPTTIDLILTGTKYKEHSMDIIKMYQSVISEERLAELRDIVKKKIDTKKE